MTWTNAFDAGECTVKVQNDVGDDYFSGVLAKGETSSTFEGKLSGETLQAVVSSDGAVSLEYVSGSGPSKGYVLNITPSYDVASAGMKMSNISIPDGVSGSAQAWTSNDSEVPAVTLTSSGGDVWTPDPIEFTDTPHESWNVYMGALT